jgi:hypothetical protein
MRVLGASLVVVATAGMAVADPATPPSAPATTPPPAAAAGTTATSTSSLLPPSVLLLPPTPVKPEVSLRIEAARVAAERFEDSWRYPDVEPFVGLDSGMWFVGAGHYRPRNARSAALHGGSVAATMLGEILLSADSPVAGFGALLTGATLDSAAADADEHR